MLILDRRAVDELLDIDALIDGLASAMDDLSAGRVSMPPRTFAMVPDRGLLASMPVYVGSSELLTAKLVLVFHDNAAKGLDTHQAVVAVFDPHTGVPVALMDGASITATRTAAGSALATRLLSRRDAKVLAIIGSGVQARSHARAVRRVRQIDELLLAGRSAANVEALAGEIGAKPASIEEAVRSADIVCACTSATEPVVRREWLRPGTHVNAVGFAPGPELEPEVFRGAVVGVESRDVVIGEHPNGAVDITSAVEGGLLDRDGVVEIGELVAGTRAGRTDDAQITVYRSLGVAVQDAVAAGIVLEAARRTGAGAEVDF
jgi:ornithine cyclodeaminase